MAILGWTFQSPVGLFLIKPHPHQPGRWNLWFGDDVCGSYSSQHAAADDVFMHATGAFEWDDLEEDPLNDPTDLGDWEPIRGR